MCLDVCCLKLARLMLGAGMNVLLVGLVSVRRAMRVDDMGCGGCGGGSQTDDDESGLQLLGRSVRLNCTLTG